MEQQTGKYLIIAGAVLVIAGVAVYFFSDAFRWLGRLPGDVKIEGKNSKFYFPWVTMLVISIVLTILINILRKLF